MNEDAPHEVPQQAPTAATVLAALGLPTAALVQQRVPKKLLADNGAITAGDKRVINEGNHRTWKQPYDADGLWERALLNPAQYTDFVIVFEGDAVWQAMQTQHLKEIAELHATGQARAVVYQAR